MKIEIDENIKEQIKEVFEPLARRPLTDQEVFEIFFNLRGFGQTLLKMAKEINYTPKGGISRVLQIPVGSK